MIFDTHAHYSRHQFNDEFGAWTFDGDGFSVERFTRESLFDKMRQSGIVGVVLASMEFEKIPTQLALAKAYPDFLYVAVGVHPKYCRLAEWKERARLEGYLKEGNAVAVGETGLDYHIRERKEQRRFAQKRWFRYQIGLADRLGLPLILHVRNADTTALRILRRKRKKLHGGVAHCFHSDLETARAYLSLGFAIGIGGKILGDGEEAKTLCRTVEGLSLHDILLETDAPFVAPADAVAGLNRKQRPKIFNSSLILPAVVQKIAELKGISLEEVERITTENAYRVFGIGEKE